MRACKRATTGVGIALCLTAVYSHGQEPTVFRTTTTLVHLNVEVLDTNGRIIAGLRQSDFKVFENNQWREIALFLSEEQPLDLLFLLDTSSSMRRRIREVAAASRDGLRVLKTGDRISIMTFNTGAQVELSPTTDLPTVEHEMQRVAEKPFHGGTRIQAAVVSAAQYLRRHEMTEQRRRAVLIITDNLGVPTSQEKDAINDLREADASLNGLVVSNRAGIAGLLVASGARLHGGIDNIVDKTGGDQMKLINAETDLPRAMTRIRTEYSLYYAVPENYVDMVRDNRVELTMAAQQRYPSARAVVKHAYTTRTRDSHGFVVR